MPKHQDPKSAAYTSARKLPVDICPKCNGERWMVELVSDGIEAVEPCPTCKGNGFVYVEDKPTKKTAPPLVAPATEG